MQVTHAGVKSVPPERITQDARRRSRSPRTLPEAASDVAAKVRGLLGDDAAIQISQPDAAGRLRLVWREGETPTRDVNRARLRRLTHAQHRASLVPTGDGGAVAFLPLATSSASLGTLEIDAGETRLGDAWDAIGLLGGHLAATIQATREFDRLRNEIRTLEAASLLGRRLARVSSTAAGVEMAVRFLGTRFRVPAAGWTRDGRGTLNLVATSRVGLKARAALTVATVASDEASDADGADALRSVFTDAVGSHDAVVLDAGPAMLVIVRDADQAAATIDEIGALFGEMLRLVADNEAAVARKRQLDMGLAWTAHELNGPLMGVRAALEAMDGGVEDPQHRAMMRSSVRELDRLMGTTEALLTWAAGKRSVRREPEDLLTLVAEAVDSSRHETGAVVIVRETPPAAIVAVDREFLRTAIANLLRNAAQHAEPGTPVEVSIVEDGDRFVVRVSDRGPVIPAEDRLAIFDPFVRGGEAQGGRTGHGLGLFITRRVVEAHGGSVWVESARGRTTFAVALPAEHGRVTRFAS